MFCALIKVQIKLYFMSLTANQIKQIAHLARLSINDDEIPQVTGTFNQIVNLLNHLQQIDTNNVQPLTNPLELTQRLRQDIAIHDNQRDYYQNIAPQVSNGLYLVPKVIE